MINYLQGKVVEIVKSSTNKFILILEVNQIGYEVQIPSRLGRKVATSDSSTVQIFTHLLLREEQPLIYGFASAVERDLFRQLISVSGVGNQLSIALIDTLGLEELVQAIVTGNIRVLCKTPGVGQKTAERIALELKTKLAQWRQQAGVKTINNTAIPSLEIIEDLQMTLLALGYTKEEIEQAISVLSQDDQLLKNPQVEEWIRSAIAHLSLSDF